MVAVKVIKYQAQIAPEVKKNKVKKTSVQNEDVTRKASIDLNLNKYQDFTRL
jgi:hypothetical protein